MTRYPSHEALARPVRDPAIEAATPLRPEPVEAARIHGHAAWRYANAESNR